MSQSFHNLKSSAANNTACLSVVMPVYNEAATVEKVIGTVLAQPTLAELIAVDDGSSDRIARLLAKMRGDHPRL
jgi:glycosyltransferase involved in cell wall biosynthesis